MAKVQGPLMSMQASGKFGGALVFANRIGTNVARLLVTPSNPQSLNQETARNYVRVAGAGQRFAKLTALKYPAATLTDKALLSLAAPTGQTWNGYLVKGEIGVNAVSAIAADALWTGFTSMEKTAWDDAAAALVPAIPAVAQKGALGVPATSLTAGHVFLRYVYGLYALGIHAIPTATPPTYA